MDIIENSVVSMHYSLTDDQAQLIDSSQGKDPLAFIYGKGMIIPGLERELAGKAAGDKLEVTVKPEDGYGLYNEQLVGEVDKKHFPEDMELQAGMPVQAENTDGSIQVLMVAEVKEDSVVLDGNHPLAGKVLNFEIEIVSVREATPEELDHGHVH